MKIHLDIENIGIVSMRQILYNSDVRIAKCFRLGAVQFLAKDNDCLAQYALYFEDASFAIVEVYFDTTKLRVKVDTVEGSL